MDEVQYSSLHHLQNLNETPEIAWTELIEHANLSDE
jgi:hypothetical protein